MRTRFRSYFDALALLVIISIGPLTRQASAATCTADSSGKTDASSAIQACLNLGGTVTLSSGGTYLIGNPLSLNVSGTTLTSDGASHFTLKASTSLVGRIINADTSSYTVSHLTLVGLKVYGYHSTNLHNNDCGNYGQNAYLQGSDFLVNDLESYDAACGSGLAVAGSGFEVENSNVHDNGWQINSFSPRSADGSWSDGMTILGCNGGHIYDNTASNNTDIDIVVGGGPNCTIDHNTISNHTVHAFGGLHIGWFPGGNGNHSGGTYSNNTISSSSFSFNGSTVNGLAFGIVVGYEAWYNSGSDDVNYPHTHTQWVSNAGSVTSNSISGASVNLAVEGIGTGYIEGNSMSGPYNPGSGWFPGYDTCSFYANYTAHFFGSATLQSGWASAWFFASRCGFWDTAVPYIDGPGSMYHGQYIVANQAINSGNGDYHLLYQSDGNLVLYNSVYSPLWAEPGPVGGPYRAWMQEDGNFVVYSHTTWATGTPIGYGGNYIVVQNDGNVVVYYLDGTIKWHMF